MPIYIDLTNLINITFLTGIQRVTNEVVIRFIEEQNNIILVVYDNEKESFVRLDNDRFVKYYKHNLGRKASILTKTRLNISDIKEGSIFFDIDSVWNNRLKRSYLYPILKRQNVTIVVHIYDIIPVLYPQYCHSDTIYRFLDYIGATIQYADNIITNTESTHKDLQYVAERVGVDCPQTTVVPLGCDFKKNEYSGTVDPKVKEIVKKGKYVLQVGTIEPRKNHKLVLDAFDKGLKDCDINIIFVGRLGWNIEDLKERIDNHKYLNKRIFHLEGCNDETVDYLYKHAFLTLFPTYYEGFGLPIIESLERGTPVICSKCKVLREVGKEYCDYVDEEDPKEIIECIKNYENNLNMYNARKEQIKTFKYVKWDEAASEMSTVIMNLSKKKKYSVIYPKQMVILSAQVKVLLNSIEFVEKFMKFIKEIVILLPEKIKNDILQEYKGSLKLKFLTDEEILNGKKLPDDHQARNIFLRYEAIKNQMIDDVFIMSDDDYRPIVNISEDVFINYGRYNIYYSYDLKNWKGTVPTEEITSYDNGMFNTYEYLSSNGLPTKQYSAHMPQIIDKRILLELLSEHPGIQNKCIDEWSMYFNYAVNKYSELFEPQVYKTLCWPALPSDWELEYYPDEYLFENYYPSLYEKNNIFSGFSETYHDDIITENINKIKIRDDLYSNHKAHAEAIYAIKTLYEISCNEKFNIHISNISKKIHIKAPKYIVASKEALIKLDIEIENDENIELEINYDFVLGETTSIMHGETLNLKLNRNKSKYKTIIPIWTPKIEGRFNLHIHYVIKYNSNSTISKKINTSTDAIIYSI